MWIFFFGGGGGEGGGHYEIGLFLRGVISIHFRAFYFNFNFNGCTRQHPLVDIYVEEVKIQNGNIFSAAKFQIFMGMP